MKHRPLGRTGLYVSELCFGTMTFGGQGWWKAMGEVDQGSANALVERALAAGVNFIDTADVYSEGHSERIVGQALRDLKVKREDVIIATKVRGRTGPGANAVGLSRGHIMDGVEASLKRLGLDYIDLYQVHGADLVTPIEETMRALDNLVSRGLVRYIGCSNMAAWQIMKALGLSRQYNYARFETVQAYYTIAGRDLEREIIPMLQDQQLGLMVWSPLAGGLLSGKFGRQSATPNDARRLTFDFPPVNKERAFDIVDVMRPIADAHGVSVARIALAWLLHQKAVMSVIIGAKTIPQLEDNLAATDITLSAEELATLDQASALAREYPQWMLDRQHGDRLPPTLR
ncbi:aldo/keto reductase [Bradyrhizobium sp. U87765 SZCCT0131]|uniref:aldo/keto reductase n=1 Tax=unclassified Bradyrhizobium TaxID=2631580 RepID=UPI001BA44B94|nr:MULTISPECIES: aldo/keto reductase [unclassified Bradyrhizobium]MBR1221348.1 aldo/keto reductase [Bradyrhizobium sp. U87765 SZCCT0131]MBR1264729.1 aldo/keto reductase [Bradyrhizobium sp. U87765 SZCCT0134]MBR1304365.1 aldo/keto reductase [Bradyrhizobium sp. U87765 SZCCT0110]MBR1322778.1 aldo/keto reductase [Bradyrhizobium sp. U87765 SZCCT0109]MBR1346294.1 aldo/keto reductase [Bradyrhizobium sp. U87765 SZCCT0048]